MGIIVSTFPGCGKSYLMNTHGNKAKMLDAWAEFSSIGEPTGDGYDYDYNLFVDEVMKVVDDYDILFIPSTDEIINSFNERAIDYDLFYPSKERRGEFIENLVRKRANRELIMQFDRNFDKIIEKLDNMDDKNCYKHQLKNNGEFIGNDPSIMSYIDSLRNG